MTSLRFFSSVLRTGKLRRSSTTGCKPAQATYRRSSNLLNQLYTCPSWNAPSNFSQQSISTTETKKATRNLSKLPSRPTQTTTLKPNHITNSYTTPKTIANYNHACPHNISKSPTPATSATHHPLFPQNFPISTYVGAKELNTSQKPLRNEHRR